MAEGIPKKLFQAKQNDSKNGEFASGERYTLDLDKKIIKINIFYL